MKEKTGKLDDVDLDSLSSPKAFDEVMADPVQCRRLLNAGVPQTDLGRLRRVQLLFAHDPDYSCDQLLAELAEIHEVPTRGTEAMILMEQRLYEDVLRTAPDPRSAAPLELEDACRAHAQVGGAALALGRTSTALQHLRAALALAHALGTTYRAQAISIDWHRARTRIGDADPEGLEQLLMQPMAPRSRQWAQRVRVESLITVCAYDEALRALGHPSQDGAPEAAMREFLHTQLNLPPARPEDDPLLLPSQPFWAVTRAVRQLVHRERNVTGYGGLGEPYVNWLRMIEAYALIRNSNPAQVAPMQAALQLVGNTPPQAPSECMYWAVIGSAASILSGKPGLTLFYLQHVRSCLPRLRSAKFVRITLQAVSPELMLLLQLGPFQQQIGGLHDMSILCGQSVIHEGRSIRLPGRTGREVVLEGANHPEFTTLSRAERARLRDALTGFGRVANAGVCLRYAHMLYTAALEMNRPDDAEAWAEVYQRIYDLLSADVQVLFMPQARLQPTL